VAGLAVGAAALGVAYLLGILCDRLADTLTEDLERHHRLRFALAWPALEGKARPRTEKDWKDPFPEDALRLAALRDRSAVVAWLDYHRSRVRLTRALAVFLPAVAVALVLGLGRLDIPCGPPLRAAWMALVPGVYALVIWRIDRRRAKRGEARSEPHTWLHAPRTDRREAYDYGHDQGFAADDRTARQRRRRTLGQMLAQDPAVQGAVLLHLGALGLALATGSPMLIGLALLAAGMTALSGWSWWRISATYRHYLRQVGQPHPGTPSD
jgi:hypothetical protein